MVSSKLQDFTLKAQLGPPSRPERIVKPRKDAKVNMPIVVCDSGNEHLWYERKPKMPNWDIIELIRYLRDHWPHDREGKRRNTPIMLVCHNPHRIFQQVHEVFKDDPEWNAKFSVNASERFYISDGATRKPKVRTIQDIRISFFGFRDRNRKTKYFHPITPLDFMENFSEYGDPDWPEYIRLYHWGGSVRKWMRKNKLRFTVTRGGLAAQLLRDKRFYPENRRKVPGVTNEKARNAMPGNFYAMDERAVGKPLAGVYVIDQQNAHHYAAETVSLPDANTLFVRGRFASLSDEPFVRDKKIGFKNLMGELGLFRCRVYVPKTIYGLLPHWALTPGLHNIFVYSNELDLLKELGIEIRHVSYAWTSPHHDVGLSQYAQWAQREVKQNPEHKRWLKPTLLSAYGILGARPRIMESAFWKSERGTPYRYLLGPTPIMMNRNRTSKQLQPSIANTIHRGMIEAETRKLSIRMARQLEDEGHTVIAIHADAVLVRDKNQQLPLLPPPWRVKDRLTNFQALDNVSYKSDMVDVLPGRKHGKR